MRQNVLVLGAGGFIGQRLMAALQASSWATPIAAGHRAPLPLRNVESVHLDASDVAALAPYVARVDAVVNCIAGNAPTIVATTRALFQAASRRALQPRVIHLSSMAVYGSAVGMVDESARLNGDTGSYAAAKVEAEHLATSSGCAVLLRPGCVYGPGSVQWSGRVAGWLAAGRVGDLGAAGDGICNLVYVEDVVEAILATLRLPRLEGHAFNLGTPEPPTWNEYFLSYARALGAVPVRRISQRRLAVETRVLAPPLKMAELAAKLVRLSGVRIPTPIPPSLLKSWGQEIRLDVRKAQDLLGITWTPAATGLREAAAHWRSQAAA